MLKAPSISDIKQELQELQQQQLVDICLRLARFKMDNKELLGFLLFNAHDVADYTARVKAMITVEFAGVNTANIWFAKKTIRKILRLANKHARYAGSKEVEIGLLIHFVKELQALPAAICKAPVLQKLVAQQQKKIRAIIATLHEDLQYDFFRQLPSTD